MSESDKVVFEFEEFRFEPHQRELICLTSGRRELLREQECRLLRLLIENAGKMVTKADIRRAVWDENVHTETHSLAQLTYTLRQKLGKPTRDKLKTQPNEGLTFHVTVTRSPPEATPHEARNKTHINADVDAHAKHAAHVTFAAALYALLYAVGLVLEITYQFDIYGTRALQLAPLAFIWIFLTTVAALQLLRLRAIENKNYDFALAAMVIVSAAVALHFALNFFLPDVPITQSTRPTQTAQAANLKNTLYFLLLAVGFLALPFNFVARAEACVRNGNACALHAWLTRERQATSPVSAIYVRPAVLMIIFLILGAISLFLTFDLLAHLKPGAYRNMFMQLAYGRKLIYFGLMFEACLWYAHRLDALKRLTLGEVT